MLIVGSLTDDILNKLAKCFFHWFFIVSFAMARSSDTVEDFQPQGIVSDEKEQPDVSQYNVYGEPKQENPLEPTVPKTNFWRKMYKFFYPDWFFDHIGLKDLKLVMQTWIQVWPTVLLCIFPRSEQWIGNACFLFQIIGFIMANGGFSVVINIAIALVCALYACIGWLFLIVSSAITSHLRGWPTQEEVVQSLIADGTCTAQNAATCYQEQVTKGRFLETRCTIIWVFASIFAFTFFGYSHRYHPLMRLPYVAGSIAIVITLVNFVQMPTFIGPTSAKLIMKPLLLAFALKIVAAVIIFPYTSSSTYLRAVAAIHDSLALTCEKNASLFKTLKPSLSSFDNHHQLASDIQGTRVKLGPIEIFLISARYEISFGRFDAGDLAEIRSRIKPMLTILAGYKYFYELLDERKNIALESFSRIKRRGSLSSQTYSSSHNKLLAAFRHTYAKVGVFENEMKINRMKERLLQRNEEDRISLHDLDVICDYMKDQYSDFLDEVPCTLKAIASWFRAANDFRAYSIFKWSKHVEAQKREHASLLQHYDALKEEVGKLDHCNELIKGLANELSGEEQRLCLVSQSSLFLFFCKEIGNHLLELCEVLLDIDETRPTPQIITMFSNTRHDKKVTVDRDLFDDNPVDAGEYKVQRVLHGRDPDMLDPENLYQAVVSWVFRSYRKLYYNTHFWFWIRLSVLLQFCCFPYYFSPSVEFYTTNRLIWLPVTCAVSITEYTAETVYGFVAKVVYSLVGCLAGMVGWYISTGSGNGNPYGYGVVTAVIYFLTAYYRQFAVHQSKVPNIMVSVTPVLVLGTSWTDTRDEFPSNIGAGWRPAVTRFVSVIVGLTVALLASCLPKPRSSKVAVRRILANILESSNEMFCLISEFALQRIDNLDIHIKRRHDKAGDQMRGMLLSLAQAKAMMGFIKYETAFTGNWPTETYSILQTLVTDLIQLYYLIYLLINQVQDTEEWLPVMLDRVGWTNSDLVAEVLALTSMSAFALRRKSPLPKVTNANMSLKHFDAVSAQWGVSNANLNERFYDVTEDESEDYDDEDGKSHLRKRQNRMVNYQKLLSHDGQLNIVCLLVIHLAYKKIDEIVVTVKALVGEKYDVSDELFKMRPYDE